MSSQRRVTVTIKDEEFTATPTCSLFHCTQPVEGLSSYQLTAEGKAREFWLDLDWMMVQERKSGDHGSYVDISTKFWDVFTNS